MANPAKKYVKEEIGYLTSFDRNHRELSAYARNLNLAFLQGKIGSVYNREAVITAVQKILLRKNKGNVLLTGSAGCGKTAIAEGLAGIIAQSKVMWRAEDAKAQSAYSKALDRGEYASPVEIPKPMFCDYVLYDLSLNALVAGTKYRGEFEEKLEKIMEICQQNPNIILFIDEIHQVVAVGASEGATNAGQILKPALARGDIRVIGATTTEEMAIIKKDKALARRFSEVIVPQLVGDSAVSCAERVLEDYSEFHGIKCNGISAKYLVEQASFHLPGSVFPNNVIDIIDETMASAKFDGLTEINTTHINATLSRMAGVIIL